MIKKNISIEDSYQMHIENERNKLVTNQMPSSYTNPHSVDAWRHERMQDMILPLINLHPDSKWITLGDGSFGSDAYYLQNKGLDVLATSISDETLSIAQKQGYIRKFKKMNAEKILEDDNFFDFVFCKEAFHHFPRPYIALYEMLRVASKGVILIEPQENRSRIFDVFKKLIKVFLRKDSNLYFETVGNFIFRINIKELSKVMTALNHKYIAFRKFNDFYFPSVSAKSIKGINKARIFTFLGIGLQNILCKLRLMNYGLAAVILFKNDVKDEILKDMRKNGFRIIKLPINPYGKEMN